MVEGKEKKGKKKRKTKGFFPLFTDDAIIFNSAFNFCF